MTEGEDGRLYPDAVLADERAGRHWFIKFARNQALADDQVILRAEYLYYKALAGFVKPSDAYQRLRQDAQRLLALPDILSDLGLPDAVMNHPAIALGKLERRMGEWGLI